MHVPVLDYKADLYKNENENKYLFVKAFIDTDMAPSDLQIIKLTVMFWSLPTTMVVKRQDFSDINANK